MPEAVLRAAALGAPGAEAHHAELLRGRVSWTVRSSRWGTPLPALPSPNLASSRSRGEHSSQGWGSVSAPMLVHGEGCRAGHLDGRWAVLATVCVCVGESGEGRESATEAAAVGPV